MRRMDHDRAPSETDVLRLVDKYGALLLDAYGVLVDESRALPHAPALIAHLNESQKPYYVLTNSASQLPDTMAGGFRARGLPIPPGRIIASGQLLGPYFEKHDLQGRCCLVLGTEDSQQYVRMAGGEVVAPAAENDAEVVVIADQVGFPIPEALDETLSIVLRRLDERQPLHLLLCNPDLLYPKAPGRFGFTAGGLAAMFEAVLRERYVGRDVGFVRLGKPYGPIFDEAVRRAGTRNLVMVGDSLVTDILGAHRAGLDSALVDSGLASLRLGMWTHGPVPTYILRSLELCA